MPHSLSVTRWFSPTGHELRLGVHGCFTCETQPSLMPHIHQARAGHRDLRLIVDLRQAEHIDAEAMLMFRRAVDEIHREDPEHPVLVMVPDVLPSCPPAGERSSRGRAQTAVADEPADTARSGPARREEILQGAAEMFAEHGFQGSSLRDISSHIGISHPGLMHHFPSKQALLDGVIDLLEAQAQEVLDRTEWLSADTSSLLRALSEIWDPASPRIQLLATLQAESVSTTHPGRVRMARVRRVHEHVLERCFARLAERGLLREGIEPDFAGRAVVALALNLAVREKTIRQMQGSRHDDGPVSDLVRLARAFLRE